MYSAHRIVLVNVYQHRRSTYHVIEFIIIDNVIDCGHTEIATETLHNKKTEMFAWSKLITFHGLYLFILLQEKMQFQR